METKKFIQHKNRRKFLRLPLRTAARIHFNDGTSKTVYLIDISTKGLSFISKEQLIFPTYFSITFKIRSTSHMIKATVNPRDITEITDGMRIGCIFHEISEENQEAIEKFIWNSVRLSAQFTLISWTSFLFAIDSLVKAFFIYIYQYYTLTGIGIKTDLPPVPSTHLVLAAVYVLGSIGAFLISDIVSSRQYKNFLAALICLLPAFCIMLIKNLSYFAGGFPAVSAIPFFKSLLLLQSAITLLGLWCLIYGFSSLKKIKAILTLVKEHQEGVFRKAES